LTAWFAGFQQFLHSIRFRLVLWFTLILALVLLAFSTFIFFNQARDIRGDALFRLERKLGEVEDTLTGSPKTAPILQPSDVFVVFDSKGGGVVEQGIKTKEDALSLIQNAQNARHQQFDSDNSEETAGWWLQRWPENGSSNTVGGYYYFIERPFFFNGQVGLAILGSPYDPYNLNNRLLVTLLIGCLLTIAIAITGGLWLADRAMRPVHAITQAARTISETDLNRRLNMAGRDELSELANTFDGMLSRLQSAFERQRQFVADASHELRTPLTIVNLESSRALASKRSPQEYKHTLEIIRSENELMSHLVSDLLMLARMDSGQLEMAKEKLDLSDIALDAVERLSSLAERKGVRLEIGELDEINILGDRQFLLLLISNLVENGIKYTLGAEKFVKIDTGLDENTAWLRVKDNGSGISAEHLPHLFDRFYRVDKARSREEGEQQGGIGLGLSIVDWIVKAHHGTVKVESELGSGTTFEVRFEAV